MSAHAQNEGEKNADEDEESEGKGNHYARTEAEENEAEDSVGEDEENAHKGNGSESSGMDVVPTTQDLNCEPIDSAL